MRDTQQACQLGGKKHHVDALDENQKKLRVYVKVKQHALCVAPSPELADDCAYLDQALCTFVGVSHNDKVDVEPIKVTCDNFLRGLTVEAWALAPCGGQHRNSLAARVRQEFCKTIVKKDQTCVVRCDDVDWKVVVRDLRCIRNGEVWGYMGVDLSINFLNIHQVAEKDVQASRDESTKATTASMTKRIQDLEAALCALRTTLFDLQHDLQRAPTSTPPPPPPLSPTRARGHQVEVAKAFVDSFPTKDMVFFYRHPHMKPFVTSTTFYANFIDAKSAFNALVKRDLLERQEDDENAFNLRPSSVTRIDLAVNFDQNGDVYAMLGTTCHVDK